MPSVDFQAACASIDAEVVVLPPVQQGDLLRLSTLQPDVVGIVDGNFFQVPAVLHKEILLLIERGVRVLGAASLGALRAAELDVFGMEGVGEIYRWYQQGIIDGDDEVAVLQASEHDGFQALSEPLVNIRFNLKRAQNRRIISARTARAMVVTAKQLHFTERSYDAALAEAELSGAACSELTDLRAFWQRERIDLKREDALALVRTIADRVNDGRSWPHQRPVKTSHTLYLHLFEREYVGHSANGQHVADALVLSFQKLLSLSYPRFMKWTALRCLALDEAWHHELEPREAHSLVLRFRSTQDQESAEDLQTWLDEHHMTYDELVITLRDHDLIARLLDCYRSLHPEPVGRAALYRRIVANVSERIGLDERQLTLSPPMQPGIPWDGMLLREMKLRGKFHSALALAARILEDDARIAHHAPGFGLDPTPARLEAWIAPRWGVQESAMDQALVERGFTSYREFIDVARLAFLSGLLRDLAETDPTEH